MLINFMQPETIAGRKFLFLFSHPDDEVFVAGIMHYLMQIGAEIRAVWATSGDYFGGGETRELEHAKASRLLGLPDDHIHLLRFPDLGLIKHLPELINSFRELIRQFQPDFIFVNAYEGGHPDHDCVNFVAFESVVRSEKRPEILEFPLYNGNGHFYHWWWKINSFPTTSPKSLFFPLSKSETQIKHAMMRAHATQWMYMVPARLVCPEWKMLSIGEPYRICERNRDHSQRPHPGKLNYERWFNFFMKIRFEDYQQAVIEARNTR